MKTFQKSLIAASVGAVMLAAAGTASANSLLFPYFTTVSGATSVVSLSSNSLAGANAPNGNGKEALHYVYNYGAACTHYDGPGAMTANDLLQHSVASPAAGGFGKAVATDGSTPFYFPLKDYGFLVVSTKTTPTAKISGDMAVADPATGLVVSYAGIDNGIVDTTGTGEGNFNNLVDTKFNLSFYSQNVASTSWYGVVTGNMNTAISGGLNWVGNAVLDNGNNVYDNDENPLSGTKAKSVTCSGIVNQADLMNSAQTAAIGPNGGLMHVTATPTAATLATGIIMSKLQVLPGKVVLFHREQAPAF